MDGDNSGTIQSHSVTSGIITFDDQDTYAAALIINSTNLSDVTSYLTTNITTAGQTVAFAYDKNSDGSADSTFVYNAGTGTNDLAGPAH